MKVGIKVLGKYAKKYVIEHQFTLLYIFRIYTEFYRMPLLVEQI